MEKKVKDITTSLREILSKRNNPSEKLEWKPKPKPEQEAASNRTFDFKKEPKKLNALVSVAMKGIQNE